MIREVVGNDVVDLTDPWIARHHLRGDFISRVCAPAERGRVTTACDLWSLFAAKEAAYKALVKAGYSPGFAHREIVVASDLGGVRWRSHDLALSVAFDEQYVHAMAWSSLAHSPTARIARAETEEGIAARDLVCELVSAATGCAARELVVVRDAAADAWDGFAPPRVKYHGAVIGVDVSMSHDGPFVAAAVIVVDNAKRGQCPPA